MALTAWAVIHSLVLIHFKWNCLKNYYNKNIDDDNDTNYDNDYYFYDFDYYC